MKFVFYTTIVFFAFLFLYVCSVYLGSNPINLSEKSKAKLVSFFPQGWAFFTRDAKMQNVYFFNVKSDKLTQIELNSFTHQYYFGLNKESRVINAEISNIMSDNIKSINEVVYRSNSFENVLLKLNDTCNKLFYTHIKKKDYIDFDLGKYIIIIEEPVYWSMAHINSNYKHVFRLYPITIE
ncbi:MAG: SdpA family antimicrobial peptide system protein [Chitinophagales bacterium]